MSKMSIMVLALVGAALPAAAAPSATQSEADRLRGLFERYTGRPGPGEAPGVTVVPEGTGYRASFDIKQILRPLEGLAARLDPAPASPADPTAPAQPAAGLSIEPATQSMILTPNDNGTWHVGSTAMPPLVIHFRDQTVTVKAGTTSFEGTYDPKLGVFIDQTMTQDGVTQEQEGPTVSQHRRTGRSVLTQKAVPADDGRADVDIRSAMSDVTAQTTMRSPPPPASVAVEPTAPPTEIAYTLPTAALDLHVGRLRAWSLLDLWAFFVAHPSREAVTAAQDDLRGLLKAALPMIGSLRQAGSVEGLAVQTQVGAFKIGKAAGSLDLADLAAAGTIATTLSIEALALPTLSLPEWSAGLLPTSLDLRPTVTGLHVDEAAREAVQSFDLRHDGFTPEQNQKIGKILWPGDGKITLAPSRITSPLLDLKLEGEASIGVMPAGHLTVTGTGLDKAIASLQAVADTDETAAQVLTQFVAAKNLAKPNPDGSYVWRIEAAANGPVSVNGVQLK